MAEGEVVGDLPVGGQSGIKQRGWDGSSALSFRFGDLYKGLFPEALKCPRSYRVKCIPRIFCLFVSLSSIILSELEL